MDISSYIICTLIIFSRHGIQLSYTIMRYDNYLAFLIVQPTYQTEFDFGQTFVGNELIGLKH